MRPQECEAKAEADFRAVVDTVIKPKWIHGITDDNGNADILNDGTITARVLPTGNDDLRHWCDDWLDPYWNLQIVDDPNGLCANVPFPWTFGPSYQEGTGKRQPEQGYDTV